MTGRSAALLRGVDLAAFAVALVTRARAAGVAVSASGGARFTEALRVLPPTDRRRLYWIARVTLVSRRGDIAAFDAVFGSVFDAAVLPLDPAARAAHRHRASRPRENSPEAAPPSASETRVPWTTREVPAVTAADVPAPRDEDTPGPGVTLRLPSALEALADEPFGGFRDEDLAALGRWFEAAAMRWPTRRTRRRAPHRHGRVDLRATLRRARGTAFEPIRLTRYRRRVRRRRIVLLCDVSRSMRGYADVYLHLMRAAVLRAGHDAEVFAFSTRLTRLTPVLAHHDAEVAVARANERVVDRFGGTHIARSLAALSGSPHGSLLRGAVVIIASDGWDSDPPAELGRAVARIRRRAHRLVWLDPRAGAPGFEPAAGSLLAALPYCDHFLPAHTITALGEMLTTVADAAAGAGPRGGPRSESDTMS